MATNKGIYCKYIGHTDKGLLLRLADEEVVELPLGDFTTFENYNIINGRLDTNCKSFIPIIDEGTIYSYENLSNPDSEKSKKAYTKAMVLGIAEDKLDAKIYNTLLVMDYNNHIESSLIAETSIFTGAMPLTKRFGEKISIKCNTAVIDNPCVYSYIIPTDRPRVIIYAEDYILRHKFIDILTVREIFYIFDIVYEAVKSDYKLSLCAQSHRKIIMDIDKANLSPEEVEEEIKEIMHTRWRLIRRAREERFQQFYNIGRTLMASFAACYSLYESLGYKSDTLESILQQIKTSIENDTKTLSYSTESKSRYEYLSREFERTRRTYR